MTRTVLITGAARRIGKSIALHFAKKGYHIAAHYSRSEKDARALKQLIEENGNKISLFQADFTQSHSAEKLFQHVSESCGAPDILINNAAMFERDDGGITEQSLQNHMMVNAAAPILMTQLMRKDGQPHFVFNMLDRVPDWSWPHLPAYVLSKTALETWTHRNAPHLMPSPYLFGLRLGPTLRNPRESEAHFNTAIAKTDAQQATQIEDILKTIDACIENPEAQPVCFDL